MASDPRRAGGHVRVRSALVDDDRIDAAVRVSLARGEFQAQRQAGEFRLLHGETVDQSGGTTANTNRHGRLQNPQGAILDTEQCG